ncbi:hypothetical protein COV15_03210 [Candidatus Woesearchaeota archaeon CG10_big_fil_rev_8_21_14_0_10_34_12]|nr:MAG: hypothetical protein COV15_03210 [Candidatus Woesearchaeota archaeon CG10_big_fil_rev_8_21_14_0_10_34_12]
MIEKLFTSKVRIKILEYLMFRSKESYLRKISNELRISPSAVKREIENLNSIGIVRIKEKRILLNEKCSFLSDLKNIFIKTDFIAHPLGEALKDSKVKYAFIFGSFSKGDYNEQSDVDLMIVGETRVSELYKLLRPVEKAVGREINPVVWTAENLAKEKNNSFVREIFKKEIIMVRGEENELRKLVK